jgi:hypothetical protein
MSIDRIQQLQQQAKSATLCRVKLWQAAVQVGAPDKARVAYREAVEAEVACYDELQKACRESVRAFDEA